MMSRSAASACPVPRSTAGTTAGATPAGVRASSPGSDLPSTKGELTGTTADGRALSGHAVVADRQVGAGGRRETLVELHGSGELRGLVVRPPRPSSVGSRGRSSSVIQQPGMASRSRTTVNPRPPIEVERRDFALDRSRRGCAGPGSARRARRAAPSRCPAGMPAARRPADRCPRSRQRARPRHGAGEPDLIRRPEPFERCAARSSSSVSVRAGMRSSPINAGLDRVRLALQREDRPGDRLVREVEPAEAIPPDTLRRVRPDAAARCIRTASAAPTPARRRRDSCWTASAGGRGSMRSSTTKPLARNSRIHSPYGSWNVVDVALVDGVHPEIVEDEPVAGVLVVGRPGERLDRRGVAEREQAAGTKQPRDLGHGPVGVGERHRAVVAEDDVERRVRERHVFGAGLDEREVDARSVISSRACSSCRAETSSPTIRAPRCASAIDHWAAPHPNSRTSRPATSPRICSSASGIW